jgi:mono/diheme cytochrome c family protein
MFNVWQPRSEGMMSDRHSQPGRSFRLHGALTTVIFVAGLVLALFNPSSSARAEDDVQVRAGLAVWKAAGCSECHGPFANGDKQRGEAPTGANLRQTKLNDADMRETITCGRPGIGMPSFGQDAYTKRACYELPLGAPPDTLYPASSKLHADEIDKVIVYLRARVVGRRAVTAQECAYYYGDDAGDFCEPAK